MRVLVTGAAGFIGFHLCKFLIEKKIKVIGIDNLNNYYSKKLKKHRLKILEKSKYNKYFSFKKIDIKRFLEADVFMVGMPQRELLQF